MNSYENLYTQKQMPDMLERRGCFSALHHEGYIYVIGGLNYTEKCLKKCERLRLVHSDNAVSMTQDKAATQNSRDDGSFEKWHKVCDMREARKNASACSMTPDTIYVFGGTSNSTQTLSSIEQYSVTSNRWQFLRVTMPRALCFLSTFKFSPTQVLIMGGSMRENPPSRSMQKDNKVIRTGRNFLSNQVFLFDLLEPKFTRMANMRKGFISLYPPFYDGLNNALMLVNEDSADNEPECLRYTLDEAGF